MYEWLFSINLHLILLCLTSRAIVEESLALRAVDSSAKLGMADQSNKVEADVGTSIERKQ